MHLFKGLWQTTPPNASPETDTKKLNSAPITRRLRYGLRGSLRNITPLVSTFTRACMQVLYGQGFISLGNHCQTVKQTIERKKKICKATSILEQYHRIIPAEANTGGLVV